MDSRLFDQFERLRSSSNTFAKSIENAKAPMWIADWYQEQSINELTALYNEVKQVGGHFITVWHAEVLRGFDVPFASLPLYEHLLEHLV